MRRGLVAVTEAQTVAVLFTDLVGSTARQSEVGDERFDEIRRAHFAVLRDVVDAHQGTEVKNLGDGLMVVFRSASNAIAAAAAMQVENDRHGRAHPDLAVGIKVAAAMGDAVLEEDDWFGTPVVEAARLCAVCGDGQVLVTESLRLMAGSRTAAPIERVGELELKGLPDPVPTCEVRWEPAEVTAGVPLPGLFAGDGAAPFAGRADERATLDRLWKEARTAGRRVAFVAGEPGIGKTRLVAELARDVHAEGGVVLVGRSDDEINAPYRPFADALDHLARHGDDDLLAEHAEEMGGVVGRLAPALTRRTGVEPEPMSNDPEMERVRQFHAVADLLTRQTRRAPVLLVLDDVHWADRSSLLLLRDLVRRLDDAAVLVVGTYRDTDLDRAHPLAAMLADFRREPGVERLALSGLSEDEVLDLLTLTGGHELDVEGIELGRRIAETSSGNPFFVGETLRHLAESGAIRQEDGRWVRGTLDPDDSGVPEGVREVVGRRLSALDDATQQVLAVAAVAGAEFDAVIVAAVADRPLDDVLDGLDLAVARNLLVEDPDRFGGFRFAHALVRQTLEEELSTTRRLRLHRALAEATEAHAPDRVEEIAHHYLEAAATGVAEQAVAYARRAADAATERIAPEQTMRWLRRALEAEEGLTPDPGRRAELLVQLGEAAFWADDMLGVAEDLLEASALAGVADRPDLQAWAAYWYLGPSAAFVNLSDVNGRVLLEEALAGLDACSPDQFVKERVWVLGKLAYTHMFDTDPTEKLALTAAAVELSEGLPDPVDRWVARAWRVVTLFGLGHHAEWEALVEWTAELAEDLPVTIKRDTITWQALVRFERGDVAGGLEHVTRYVALFEPLGLALPALVFGVPAVVATWEGRFDDADPLFDAWLDASNLPDLSRSGVLAGQAWPYLWTLDAPRYRAALDSFPASSATLLAVYPLTAIVALIDEDEAEARRCYEEWLPLLDFAPAGFAAHIAASATYPTWRLDQADVARRNLEALGPHAGRWPTVGMPIFAGPADLFLGVNHVTVGDLDAGEASLRSALDASVANGTHAWSTWTRMHLANALARQGRGDEAAEHAAVARADAERLGMHLITQDLDRLGLG